MPHKNWWKSMKKKCVPRAAKQQNTPAPFKKKVVRPWSLNIRVWHYQRLSMNDCIFNWNPLQKRTTFQHFSWNLRTGLDQTIKPMSSTFCTHVESDLRSYTRRRDHCKHPRNEYGSRPNDDSNRSYGNGMAAILSVTVCGNASRTSPTAFRNEVSVR